MKTKIITIITSLVAACGLVSIFTAPTPAYADVDICGNTNIPEDIRRASGCPIGGDTSSYDLTSVIQNIINGVILALGTVAVVLVVIGGVSYMTSAGDAGKLKKAKDTILYACIGLVICVLSFAITNFTISLIGSNGGSSASQSAGGDSGDDGNRCFDYDMMQWGPCS